VRRETPDGLHREHARDSVAAPRNHDLTLVRDHFLDAVQGRTNLADSHLRHVSQPMPV
jgi:hypothetical protein